MDPATAGMVAGVVLGMVAVRLIIWWWPNIKALFNRQKTKSIFATR